MRHATRLRGLMRRLHVSEQRSGGSHRERCVANAERRQVVRSELITQSSASRVGVELPWRQRACRAAYARRCNGRAFGMQQFARRQAIELCSEVA